MKPLLLIMHAFGAYADEQTIDFSLLQEKTFFLIHGPTGSGKTTILDAIAFALYGVASGDLRDNKNLRSDYAPPSLKTQVEFTFLSGQQKYEVLRSPEQEIFKTRGEGTRKYPASAVLYQINEDGKTIMASGTTDVTREIESLLGFKSDQFRQIVVLPQGEFRRFLLADSKERKGILEILFKTNLYRQIEEKLNERKKNLEDNYKELKSQKLFLLETAGCESLEQLALFLQELEAQMSAKQQELQVSQQAFQLAQEQHNTAKALAAAFTEFTEAQQQVTQLQIQQLLMDDNRLTLAQAEKAALIEPYYNSCLKLNQKLKVLQKQQQHLALTLTTKRQANLDLQAELQKYLPEEITLDNTSATNKLQDFLAQLLTEQEYYKSTLKIFSTQADLSQKLSKTNQEVQSLQLAFTSAEKALQTAETTLHNAQIAELNFLAGRLAHELEAGKPCPVCGALEHPHPAQNEAENVTTKKLEQEVKLAHQNVLSANSKLTTAQARKQEQQLQFENLTTELQTLPFPNLETLETHLKVQEQKITALRQLQQRLDNLRLELSTTEVELQSHLKQLQETESEFANSRDEYKTKLTEGNFVEQTDFLKAKRTTDDITHLKELIAKFEQELAGAITRLVRAETVIQNKKPPNLILWAETEQKAQQHKDELNKSLTILQVTHTNRQDLHKKLLINEQSMQRIEDAYLTAVSLAQTATGNNSRKLSFSAFVLQAILDDVLQAANLRLTQMSRGRYNLSRIAEVIDARKENGLNLEVMDSFTGLSRPVSTLSGGEIFLASLSLALGLSDVVQAYAGGIKLDTILVDEGFGSLDSEALDMAIKTLTDLQKGGRLVGIISHVSELRERISTRLEITPGTRGSSAKFYI